MIAARMHPVTKVGRMPALLMGLVLCLSTGCQSIAGQVEPKVVRAQADNAVVEVAQLLQSGRLAEAERTADAAMQAAVLAPDALARRAIGLAALLRSYQLLAPAQRLLQLTVDETGRDLSTSALCSLLFDLASIAFDRGQVAEATEHAQRMRSVAESRAGRLSDDYMRSLILLAALSNRQRREGEALPLLEQALGIATATRGEYSELTADVLVEQARAYRGIQGPKAAAVAGRALAIRERVLGPEHADIVEVTTLLGGIAVRANEHAAALAWYGRSLVLLEKLHGPRHPLVASILIEIGGIHQMLGRFDEAEAAYVRAAEIYTATFGERSLAVAEVLETTANLQRLAGRLDPAEAAMMRALEIREGAGQQAELVRAFTILSAIYLTQGRYRDAERVLVRGRAIAEKHLPPTSRDLLTTLENLGVTYLALGRYREAESLLQQGLRMREATLGPEHRSVSNTLNNLAGLYREIDRPDVAEALFRRMLANSEKAFGPDHLDVARALTGVAVSLNAQQRAEEAEPLLVRALVIQRRQLPAGHRDPSWTSLNLGQSLRTLGRQDEARSLITELLRAQEGAFGPDHPELARTLSLLALLHADLGRRDDAEALLQRALRIRQQAVGGAHPDVATNLEQLAGLSLERGDAKHALALAREASEIRRLRLQTSGATNEASVINAAAELRSRRAAFATHVRLLHEEMVGAEPRQRRALVDESLAVVQLARANDTASALAQVAARFTVGDDELAARLRQRQDLLLKRRATEGELIRALARTGSDRDDAALDRLRRLLGELDAELAQLADQLAQRFPLYQDLIGNPTAALGELQDVLRPGEALLSYLVVDDATYAWVVRREAAVLRRLSPGRASLAAVISRLRRTLAVQDGAALPRFAEAEAHRLYIDLVQPLEPLLAGARHLIVVADGPMQGLPMSLLLSRPSPPGSPTSRMHWLVRKYSISEVPAESAFRALRRLRPATIAPLPFVGFGAPQFNGARGPLPSVRAVYSPRGLADVGELAALPALPDSATEVLAIARAMGSSDGVFIGKEANESRVKKMDLSRFRTVVFATHGLVGGELRGLAEPALALTPPTVATEEDDGLLTASEVSRLRLNADWVILSACSTAAPDGMPGGETLSGLAKAFIYAGSRSLLVSHWPVDSRAAARLTTGTISRLAGNASLGKAQALRQTMLAMIESRSMSHPIQWAPFALVGAD